MYEFIDVTEISESALPSEALQINGEYIENLIPGYRTLHVSGREALSPELNTYEVGVRDGSVLKSKRYPARVIKVTYQLVASSSGAFRDAYNEFASILDIEDAKLIFNDETDKYYVGTPSYIGEVEPGKNAVIGEFEILCTDPFKYSVEEYEVEPETDDDGLLFLIDNQGTYKSYPTLQAEFFSEEDGADELSNALTGAGDCGFVAFYNDREKIIQMGDPDEEQLETYPMSQTLTHRNFNTSGAWSTAAQNQWKLNSGKTWDDNVAQVGTMKMGAAYYNYTTPKDTSVTLLPNTKTSAGSPRFYYKVTAKTTDRKKNSVVVKVTVQAYLEHSKSFFGRGYGLQASVYIGGKWRPFTLKNPTDYWKGTKKHTVSKTISITGLTASQTELKDIWFKVTRTDSYDEGTAGVFNANSSCPNIPISAYVAPTVGEYYLTANSYGSGTGYHGASITRTIPADDAGIKGATDFALSYKQKMCIGDGNNANKERGAFQVLLRDANNKCVAGVSVYKGSDGTKAKLRFFVNNKIVHTQDIDLSFHNPRFGNNGYITVRPIKNRPAYKKYVKTVKTSSITKSGKKVTFNIGGYKKVFTDSGITDLAVTKITFAFSQYGTKTPLSYNGLYWVKFVKNKCKTWRNIPNKFSVNDVVYADCKSGKVYLNDSYSPELGALGNDYEEFYLVPGLNQIGVTYSDWVKDEHAPKFKVKYREVFL